MTSPATAYPTEGTSVPPADRPARDPQIDLSIPEGWRHVKIRPHKGWQLVDFREAWLFRELLWSFADRDLRVRYKQTILGIGWVVLVPLLTALVFTLIMGRVVRLEAPGGIPYLLFVFAALTGYNLFKDIVTRGSQSLVGNRNLVAKVYFPRVLLPTATAINSLVDFLVTLGVFIAIWIVYALTSGMHGMNVPTPGLHMLTLPFWVLVLVVQGLAVSLIASSMSVAYRDVGHLIPVILSLGLFASPIVYDLSLVQERSQFEQIALYSNPLAGAIAAIRWSLLGEGTVSWGAAAFSTVFAFVTLVIGMFVFRRMERKFADVI